jgi:hypothetical protein
MMIFLAELRNLVLSLYWRQMSHQQFSTHLENRTDIDLFKHQKYSVVSSSRTSSLNSTISDSVADVWKHEVNSYIYVLFRVLWFDQSMLSVFWVQAISEISPLCFWDTISLFDRSRSKQTNQRFSVLRFIFYTYAKVFYNLLLKWLNRVAFQMKDQSKMWRHLQDQKR